MFFSVIVPVYNVEEYLENCINSVLCQTFADFELILVDDGSPDNCPKICDEYIEKDNRIKVIHKENGGLASARQAGIKVAKGDYVYNIDSDDAIEKDTLEYAYKAICDTGCDIVSFSYKWVADGIEIGRTTDELDEGFYDKAGLEKHIYPKLLMDENMSHVSYYLSGKAIKRELLTPNQLYVDPKISLGEDLCCVFPCYMQANSAFISKKAAYLYTKRSDSLSKNFNANQICQLEYVMNFINDMKVIKPYDFEEQMCRYSSFMCFSILAAAAEGDYFKSIKEIKNNLLSSVHILKFKKAKFNRITIKSKIGIFLMKRKCIKTAFYFLNICKRIKKVLKKG